MCWCRVGAGIAGLERLEEHGRGLGDADWLVMRMLISLRCEMFVLLCSCGRHVAAVSQNASWSSFCWSTIVVL